MLNPGFVPGRNLLRHVFLDPEGRQYYLDWEEIAEGAVAGLRASAGAGPDDPRLTGLVGELSVKSGGFRQMWARHDVRARISGRKRYNNPFIGLITLDYETFTVNADPGQTLFVFRADPAAATSTHSCCSRRSRPGASPAGYWPMRTWKGRENTLLLIFAAMFAGETEVRSARVAAVIAPGGPAKSEQEWHQLVR